MTIDQLQPTILNQPFAVPTAQQGYGNAFQAGAGWPAPAATGYAPPANYAPPATNYAAPATGYAPPANGYAAPATGYAPPPTAAPPPSGYAMPAPAAVGPHTAPSGFSLSKLTPTTILVVGALVAGAWFMTHKHHTTTHTVPAVPVTQPVNPPSGRSGGQPSGQSGGQPSGQSGGQPSGQSGGQPNGQSGQSDQSGLLSHVPSDIASTCEATQANDGAPAVQCSAPDNITVEYAAYASGDTADGALSSLTGGLQTVSANGCSSGSCTYRSTTGDQGQVVWFTATVNNAPAMGVAWSSDQLGIVGLAIEPGTDNSALVKWWNQDSGPN